MSLVDLPAILLPELVVHCDWGVSPHKRWMAQASLRNGTYTASPPTPVGDAGTLLASLRDQTQGPVLLGFDFPIGLPKAYADQLAIDSFPTFLCHLEHPGRQPFFSVCHNAGEISLSRPFYPFNSSPKGSRKRSHLVEALHLQSFDQLLRACERAQPGMQPAGALFWTLGARAPGRAALHGWANVLIPALHSDHVKDCQTNPVKLWPFDGTLAHLLQPGRLVIAETYPTQYHRSILNAPFSGKGHIENRKRQASSLLAWSKASAVQLTPSLLLDLHAGIPQGDDAFDAVLGLTGMLHLLLHSELHYEPTDPVTRNIEGWILGRPAL